MSKKYVFILIISIFISFILIFVVSISVKNHKLKVIISKIVEYNNNLTNIFESSGPLDEDFYNSLNDSISSLNQLKESTDNKDAISLIDANIELNKLSLTLLSSNDFQSITDYDNSSSKLLAQLNLLNKSGFNPDIYSNLSDYKKNSLDSIFKHSIKTSQNNEFKNNISLCLKSLKDISEDLRPALNLIRKDGRTLNVLLKDIKEKKSSIYTIQAKINTLTVPEECAIYYQEFSRLISFYKDYILSLESSVTLEINNPSSSELAENFKETFQKYDDFNCSLSEFTIDDLM